MHTFLKIVLVGLPLFALAQTEKDDVQRFQEINKDQNWMLKFEDDGTGDWRENWFLDGEKAVLQNTEEGMHFQAGPEQGNHAHHAVLWTKKSFEGNLKITYEYTKTDTVQRNVNILYIQATGKGTKPYGKDISTWNHLRRVPRMRTYFDNMNTLHISYAAISPEGNKYVRARRYPTSPERRFQQTVIEPSYDNETALFKTGETYRITVIKNSKELFFKVKGKEVEKVFSWNLKDWKPITEGRIGLRHMFTRSARYAKFRVYGN